MTTLVLIHIANPLFPFFGVPALKVLADPHDEAASGVPKGLVVSLDGKLQLKWFVTFHNHSYNMLQHVRTHEFVVSDKRGTCKPFLESRSDITYLLW